jgi:hypothetical protein
MSISETASDLTGKIQSAGVERQPGVEHFKMQRAEAVSAAYYFDLAARDYILADGAIELVIEGVPCSAFIEPSQSCELIFCIQSDRLQGRKHAADRGKFRRELQEQSRRAMQGETLSLPRSVFHTHVFWPLRGGCFEFFWSRISYPSRQLR